MPRPAVPLQPDGNLVLPAPREDRRGAARALRPLAQAGLHPDGQHYAQRLRVLPHPDKPRHRARRPDRDLKSGHALLDTADAIPEIICAAFILSPANRYGIYMSGSPFIGT